MYNPTVKQITTIVSDYDGTIARGNMEGPSPLFFDLMKRLLDRGMRFVAASGRQYGNLQERFRPLAGNMGFICENGSLAALGGRILFKKRIEEETAVSLIEEMKRHTGAEIMVSGESTSYIVPNTEAFVDRLVNKVGNHVTVLKDFREIQEDKIKVSIFWPTGIPLEAARIFHEKFDSALHVVDGGNGWLDCTAAGADKGTALRALSEEMGFSLDETLVFGDSENDISMFRAAGASYAMRTAAEHVKAEALDICDTVESVLEGILKHRVTCQGRGRF